MIAIPFISALSMDLKLAFFFLQNLIFYKNMHDKEHIEDDTSVS